MAAEAPVEPAKPGKKLPKHLQLLQKQQEELKRVQEERARMDAEEKARLEEEDRKLEEENKRKEEEKARKKQKEKEKIEQLKKEGKYLTKAQKEEKARNEKKLQQMLAAGIQVGGLKDGEAAKKPSYDKKKGKGKKTDKVSIEGHGSISILNPLTNYRLMKKRSSQKLPSVQDYKPRQPLKRQPKMSVLLRRRPLLRPQQRLLPLLRMRLMTTGRLPQHQMMMSRTAGTLRVKKRRRLHKITRSPAVLNLLQDPSLRKRSPRQKTNHQMMILSSRGRGRLWQGARRLTRPLWQRAQRTTFDHQFAVFLDTSILARQSCLIKFVKPMSKKVKQVVLLSRLVPHTSPSRLLSRRLLLSTRMANLSSRSPVSWSLTHLVTSLSPTCVLEDLLFATLQSLLLISCTVLSLRPLSL